MVEGKSKAKDKKHAGGRPPGPRDPYILNGEVQELVCNALIIGLTYEDAASNAGIPRMTLNRWNKRGAKNALKKLKGKPIEPTEEIYITFHEAVNRALIHSKVRAATALDRGFTGEKTHVVEKHTDREGNEIIREFDKYLVTPDWRAAESKLMRRYPAEWGNKVVVGEDKESPVGLTLAAFMKEAAREERALMEAEEKKKKALKDGDK
jgi:hypothetical protein